MAATTDEVPVNHSESEGALFRNREFGFDSQVSSSIVKRRFTISVIPRRPSATVISPHFGPIFNQLVIIGAPRQKCFMNKPDPTILVVYPASPLILDPQEFQQIPSFCFPNGFDAIPDDLEKKDAILDQFVFMIGTSKNENSHIYGVCTTCSLLHTRNAFFYNSASKVYPVCFCYLTDNPILPPIFQFESFLVKWIGGTTNGSVKQHPFQEDPRPRMDVEVIPGMIRAGNAFRMDGFLIPKMFIQEVGFIRSVMPDPFRDYPIQLTKRETLFVPMQGAARSSIGYVGLSILFSRLSVRNIVHVVSILLLEKHVVVLSSSVLVLSLCVLCLGELCEPWHIKSTFLPVLPNTQSHFGILDSPIPFVCGIVKADSLPAIPDHVVQIDLDENQVIDPDNSPMMAGNEDLEASINALLTRDQKDILIPKRVFLRSSALTRLISLKDPSTEWVEFVKKRLHPSQYAPFFGKVPHRYIFSPSFVDTILDCFRKSLQPTLEQLVRPYLITDTTDIEHPVTVFNRELFLESVDPKHKAFYSFFLSTTMFQEFSDSMLEDTARTYARGIQMFGTTSNVVSFRKSSFEPDA